MHFAKEMSTNILVNDFVDILELKLDKKFESYSLLLMKCRRTDDETDATTLQTNNVTIHMHFHRQLDLNAKRMYNTKTNTRGQAN